MGYLALVAVSQPTLLVPVFALWLMTKIKFKGLLLVLGTLLFVAAKGILVVHLLRELYVPFP
jgi:hypothetical protein